MSKKDTRDMRIEKRNKKGELQFQNIRVKPNEVLPLMSDVLRAITRYCLNEARKHADQDSRKTILLKDTIAVSFGKMAVC